MLCSNCGYENPSEHRYCGMCGTPFPYRALTVPGAQSTLEFIAEPASEGLAEAERSVPTTVTQAGTVQDSLTQVDDAAAFGEKPGARETFADVPESPAERWEAMVRTVEIPQVATTPQPTWQSEAVEPEEPTAPAVKEPEQPVVHPAHEPEPEEPEIREPEPEAPEVIREPPLPPEDGDAASNEGRNPGAGGVGTRVCEDSSAAGFTTAGFAAGLVRDADLQRGCGSIRSAHHQPV